jgi:hypothetical protein
MFSVYHDLTLELAIMGRFGWRTGNRPETSASPWDHQRHHRQPAVHEYLLSLALSDQHARLADGAVSVAGPGGHAGRHSRRRAGPRRRVGFDWVWFLSVWRAGQPRSGSPARIPNGDGSSKRRWRICARRTSRAPGSPSPATRVHPGLGGDAALDRLRERLRKRDLRLLSATVRTGRPWHQSETFSSIAWCSGAPGARDATLLE